MSIPFNPVAIQPSLKDLLDRFGQNLMANFNCHAIGTVEVFDSTTQTATVTINYQKNILVLNPLSQQLESQAMPYPLILSAPVIILGGGLATLTFPILPGDECVVLFNDRDLDNWYQGSTTSVPNTPRLHSFADALILIGVRSLPRVLPTYDSSHALLSMGVAQVGVSASQCLISNTATTLGAQLQNLITDLQNLITALTTNAATFILVTGAPGTPSPLNPAIATALLAVSTSLTTVATALGTLLE